MRLHQLTLEAFGPFPGREQIDFDQLDHGILLVNGPTGSGKSSILDAITFALFGDVAGARRALRQSLRSHHAAPEREPSVELVFSVGPTRWKIRRMPQWEAPKRRGSGTTTRHATVQLSQWRDGHWQLVSSRIDEAAEMIRDTLGMGLDQFAQVVLLPQGEFAEFLRARPEDRRTLLERLFDVERFEAVERWFNEAKNERIRASDSSLLAIQGHVNVITDTLGRLSDDATGEWNTEWTSELTAETVAELPEQLRQLLARVRQRRNEATELATSNSQLAAAAERAYEHAGAVLNAQRFYAHALEELDTWPLERVDELHRSIETATAVVGVLSLARRCESAEREAREASADHAQQIAALEKLTGLTGLLEKGVDEVLPSATLHQQLDTLHELLLDLARLREEITDVNNAREARRWLEERVAEADQLVNDAQEAGQKAATELSAAEQAVEASPDVARGLENVDAALSDVARSSSRQAEAQKARVERERHLEKYVAAEAEVVRLRAARLNGMAAELAQDLEEGQPCPVCGSCTHPSPTQPEDGAPTEDDIAAAEQTVRVADEQRLAAENKYSSARAAYDAAITGLQHKLEVLPTSDEEKLVAGDIVEDPQPLNELHARMKDAASRHVAAQARHEEAVRESTNAGTRLAKAESQASVARTRWEAASESLQAVVTRVRATHSRVDALRAEASATLPELTPMPADNPEQTELSRLQQDCTRMTEAARAEHSRLRRVIDTVQEVRRAETAAADARNRAIAAASDLSDELVAKGYDDVESVRSVALSDAELLELRSTWQHAIETRAAATATMRDPIIAAAAMTPPPDEGRLRHRADLLSHRAAGARAGAATWQNAYDVLASVRDKVADAVRAHLPLADAAREMQELSNTFSGIGENTHRMRLTSYVLAAHLETVTAMANERLDRMTDGRYQLRYTDERAKGNQRSGLGLLVVDAWTGRSRDTATLSGGEAFMASLALALGLGDAVRADSGGMELNTLFVDEGFGSLDQDTLEQVMEVLDGLREGGRLVGVVSHVSELRARIPTHIDVRKTSEGSSIRTEDSAQIPVSQPT